MGQFEQGQLARIAAARAHGLVAAHRFGGADVVEVHHPAGVALGLVQLQARGGAELHQAAIRADVQNARLGGGDLLAAVGLDAADEDALQVSTVHAHPVGGKGEAVAGIDEHLGLQLGVPASVDRRVHHRLVGIAAVGLQEAEQQKAQHGEHQA